MENHICKVCGRSFPTGRSLGGHMKTHVVLSSLIDEKDKPVSIYGLRDKPKKSRRFHDVCPEKNTSIEMARDELKHDDDDELWSGGSYDEHADEMPSQSNKKVSLISMSVRKRRRTPKISIYSSSPALSSEYANEEMNAALCLLMLSRGTHSIRDILDEIPPIIERYKSCKRNKYVCTICDKSFPSYQALGGHCSSHRKMKLKELKSPENFESYKCSICGKAFRTGQALGGHKRSHLVEGSNLLMMLLFLLLVLMVFIPNQHEWR
ncbi:Zinc finger protein ZAT1 [Dendrobium catenatum]|uniref:Zinc finger protein ZAT1 n=1 Tax=Dendrobium catenatum TaxID=906689 RepID=A0A2I0XBE1_9ASPA|nr:Zinc finger protein ZAT1 [Dendrobium catenatum]